MLDLRFEASLGVLGSRTVSSDAKATAAYAREFLRGLKDAGVAGCGKHFPGLGEGNLDSHQALPVVHKSWKALWERGPASLPPAGQAVAFRDGGALRLSGGDGRGGAGLDLKEMDCRRAAQEDRLYGAGGLRRSGDGRRAEGGQHRRGRGGDRRRPARTCTWSATTRNWCIAPGRRS